MPRRFGALLLLAALLVGCSGSDEPRTTEAELPRIVLQPSDLEQAWIRFDEGAQVTPDAPAGRRADPDRFGRLGGWKARYRRPGSPATRGPLVIESRADLFAETDGAKRDLALVSGEAAVLGAAAEPVDVPRIGDETVATTLLQTIADPPVRYFSIVWRQDRVVASILVNGFNGRLTSGHGVALARRQEARIAAAARD